MLSVARVTDSQSSPGVFSGITAGQQGTTGWSRDAVDIRRADLALIDLADLPLQRAPHLCLLTRCWDLRDNLTIYDASYMALA